MTARSRRRLSLLARYTVLIVAVTWLVTQVKWDQLKEVWLYADKALLLVSILAFGPAPLLLALRLKWLLTVHDVRLTVWQAIKVTFAGNFIINALPVGTSGGDAVKAYYIARDTPHKHEAVTSVFFDRVIGVVGLVAMSGIVVLANWRNPALAQWGRMIAVAVVVLVVGAGTYFSHRMRRLLRLERIVSLLPLAAHLQRIDRALFAFRHRVRRLIACLALTAVLQAVAIVALFVSGWALGMVEQRPISSLPVYLAYTPVCFLAGALPLGVMEATFIKLFADAAHLGTPEAALSLSLLGRFIQLVWALPGAIVVLQAGRPQPLAEDTLDSAEPQLSTPP